MAIGSNEWERRRLTARAARRLCDKLEDLCEEDDGDNLDQTDKVFRRMFSNLIELVTSLDLGEEEGVTRTKGADICTRCGESYEKHRPYSAVADHLRMCVSVKGAGGPLFFRGGLVRVK